MSGGIVCPGASGTRSRADRVTDLLNISALRRIEELRRTTAPREAEKGPTSGA